MDTLLVHGRIRNKDMNDYDNHRCRPDYDSIASIALRKIFIGGLSYGTDDGEA